MVQAKVNYQLCAERFCLFLRTNYFLIMLRNLQTEDELLNTINDYLSVPGMGPAMSFRDRESMLDVFKTNGEKWLKLSVEEMRAKVDKAVEDSYASGYHFDYDPAYDPRDDYDNPNSRYYDQD